MTDEFNTHLQRIRDAKTQTDKAIELLLPGFATAEAALERAWELVFDRLCQQEEPLSIGDINTLTNAIQRLTSSTSNHHSIAATLTKTIEEHNQQHQPENHSHTLDEHTLKQLETQLKIL